VGVNHTHAQGHPSRSADSSESGATVPPSEGNVVEKLGGTDMGQRATVGVL